MSGGVIVTVTLNAALHVRYAVVGPAAGEPPVLPVSRPDYQAGGRGVTVARLLSAFGHDVLAAGLAGGVAGELIGQDLARSGIPAAFTAIRGESRRVFAVDAGAGAAAGAAAGLTAGAAADPTAGGAAGSCPFRFGEPGPYITTEELGRFAADYRKLLAGAAAVVLCGSLPEGLPPDMYASLVRYATEAEVPAILDAGGEELLLAARNRPALVVAESRDTDAGRGLLRLGASAAAVVNGRQVRVTTAAGAWVASLNGTPGADDAQGGAPGSAPGAPLDRGALVAGLVPGELLGWSWPDRLRHCLALAAVRTAKVDLDAYERLLESVQVGPAS
jgi:tagatose 6-phosphate kinase